MAGFTGFGAALAFEVCGCVTHQRALLVEFRTVAVRAGATRSKNAISDWPRISSDDTPDKS
jgi:hypothetical protein